MWLVELVENHYVCVITPTEGGENPVVPQVISEHRSPVTHSCTLPRNCDPFPVSVMSEVIEGCLEESIGGFYTIILMSMLPVSFYFFVRKGEWHFLKARFK